MLAPPPCSETKLSSTVPRPDAVRSRGRIARWLAVECTARDEPDVAPGARKGAPLVAGLFVRRGPKDRTLGGCSEGQRGGESDTMQEERDYSLAHVQMLPPRWGACQRALMSHYTHLRVPVLYRFADLKY